MLASTFTGVRVTAAPKRQVTRKIDVSVVARRTKASAPAKKSAFKVRSRATTRNRIIVSLPIDRERTERTERVSEGRRERAGAED